MAITANTAKFVKSGNSIDYKSESAVDCNDIIKVGGLVCIALWDIPANTPGTLKVLQRGEVVTVNTTGTLGETNAGVAVYLDASGLLTKNATSGESPSVVNNTLVGYTAAAVTSSATTFDLICA